MRGSACILLLALGGIGFSAPLLAEADEAVASADVAGEQATPLPDHLVRCVRQSVEAGVTIVRATTSDRCEAPAVAHRVQVSRTAFQTPHYCHAQGTACSFELGQDHAWAEADTPTS